MLQTLHRTMSAPKPVYGMNRGSVGFLMNDYAERGLRAPPRGGGALDHPSAADARARRARQGNDRAGDQRSVAVAAEVSGGQDRDPGRRQGAAVRADRRRRAGGDADRLDRLQSFRQRPDRAARIAADGADADFASSGRAVGAARCCPTGPRSRSRSWKRDKRPVAAAADHTEIREVARVDVETDHATSLILLHDPGHSFDERTLREQFGV